MELSIHTFDVIIVPFININVNLISTSTVDNSQELKSVLKVVPYFILISLSNLLFYLIIHYF